MEESSGCTNAFSVRFLEFRTLSSFGGGFLTKWVTF